MFVTRYAKFLGFRDCEGTIIPPELSPIPHVGDILLVTKGSSIRYPWGLGDD